MRDSYAPHRIGIVAKADEHSWVYGYRRMRVHKLESTATEFIIRIRASASKGQVRPLSVNIPAVVRSGRDTTAADGKSVPATEVAFDVSKIPTHEVVDLAIEFFGREPAPELFRATTLYVDAKTSLLTYWLLLPEGKRYQSTDLFRYPSGKTSSPERVIPANEMLSPDGQIAAFTLLSLEPGFMYERRWTYRE